MSDDIIKVAEDDPTRCQHIIASKGQCRNKSVVDGDRCIAHGGPMQTKSAEVKRLNNYRIANAQVQQQLSEFANSSGIKSLRDEVAILRMLMQDQLDKCKDSTELMLRSQSISDLVLKITTVVTSCHKLEANMGQHLDKTAILQFATEVINIVGTALEGQEDKIDEIASGILSVVGRIGEE